MPTTLPVNQSSTRLLSLDVMRGIVMLLLAAESCLVYDSLNEATNNSMGKTLLQQFFHHPWHGLRFWDLVQPAFMTMAGTALYISYYQKLQKGISWAQNFTHILIRCIKLFLLGTALHCVYSGSLVWELWNVLTQLSFTIIIAYCIIQHTYAFQLTVALLLLLLTEILYRFVLMPGFNQPFVDQHNFGNWLDMLLMGKINKGGWVAINIIPTAVHTIIGVMAGKLFLSAITESKKIKLVITVGIVALLLGFMLDWLNVIPIIKRISTSSFVLASAGWVLLLMAFLYWLIDIRRLNKYSWIFAVAGRNAIFIYLFFETIGAQWLNHTTGIFIKGFLALLSVDSAVQNVVSALVTLMLEWGICYWLWQRNIFFKL
jgi:predicted acyltransferase